MVVHITFSDGKMDKAAELAANTAIKYGAGISKLYNQWSIDEQFYTNNIDILTRERGAGYWLWKPYFINKALWEIGEDDILFYSDAGVEVIADLSHITNQLEDIFLFGNMYPHDQWCKKEVNLAICQKEKLDQKQVQASAIFLRPTEKAKHIVAQWLLWAQMPNMIDDSPGNDESEYFIEHRHDQAILTCVAHNYNIPLHWWAAVYNTGHFTYDKTGYDDTYPPIFHHHRKRDVEFQ